MALDPLDLASPLPPGNPALPTGATPTPALAAGTAPSDNAVWLVTDDTTGNTYGMTTNQVRQYVAPRIQFGSRDPRVNGALAAVPGIVGQEYRNLLPLGAFDVYEFDGALWQFRHGVGATVAAGGGAAVLALPNVSLVATPTALTLGASTTLTATASATTATGSIAKVEFFDVTTKIGEVLGSGPYALTYSPSTVGSHSITAKATDAAGSTRTSAPVTLPVLAAVNVAPTVSLALSALSVPAGTSLTLTATAAATGTTIAKVEYFDGATKIGETPGLPYSITYAPGLAGSHLLYAKATDANGLAALSPNQTLSVVPVAADVPPTVSLTVNSPANPTQGTTVSLAATAADADGTITKVEFYSGPTLIGTVTATPYTLNYVLPSPASYYFSAKATDNSGSSAQTAAVYLFAPYTPPAATVPGAPTNATATPGNNLVTVGATPPTVNGGAAITGYTIYRNGSTVALATNVALPFADATALNGTAYTYTVAAVNSVGTSALSAATASVTPAPAATATIAGPSYHGPVTSTTPTPAAVQALTAEQWAVAARSFPANCNGTYPAFAEPQSYGIRSIIQDKNGFNITPDVTRSSITLTVNAAPLNYWLYVHNNPQYDAAFVFSL
ncbi:MAG: hypothetical protein NVS3B25_07430 [Hymenobacter sp.]